VRANAASFVPPFFSFIEEFVLGWPLRFEDGTEGGQLLFSII